MIPPVAAKKSSAAKDLEQPKILRAQGRSQKSPKPAPEAVAEAADVAPELAAIVKAWPDIDAEPPAGD